MRAVRCFLVKQTVPASEPMLTQLALEIVDLALVVAKISIARKMFEPDRILFQSAQTEHPLQWHRKIAATVEIFCRKSAAEKNRHASSVVILLASSSSKMAILKEPSVRQVWLALRLMTAAESSVRDRRDGAEEHRLPSRL